MIPEDRLSTTPQPDGFLAPRDIAKRKLVDYEEGGVNISDPSQGLRVKTWTGSTNGTDVIFEAQDVAPVVVFSPGAITELSITFDQNMRPFVAFMQAGQAKFYWYDTLNEMYVTTTLAGGTMSPRCTMDDKRSSQSSTNDIILAYVRSGNLYFRMQRERYQTERLLGAVGALKLVNIGMSENFRLQFELGTY